MSVKPASLLLACCTALLCMGSTLAQPAAEPPPEVLQPYADPDAYALYATFMQQRAPGSHVRFVEARTMPLRDCAVRAFGPAGAPIADKIAEAAADSRAANARRLRLTDAFAPATPARLLTPAEAQAQLWVDRPDGTDRRPLAVISFSAAGFSHDRTVAVFRAAFRTGPGGGDITSLVYARDGAGWREVPGQRQCSAVI